MTGYCALVMGWLDWLMVIGFFGVIVMLAGLVLMIALLRKRTREAAHWTFVAQATANAYSHLMAEALNQSPEARRIIGWHVYLEQRKRRLSGENDTESDNG